MISIASAYMAYRGEFRQVARISVEITA